MEKKAALYIHIPFCQNKCKYCDYTTVRNRHIYQNIIGNEKVFGTCGSIEYLDVYIDAIIKEMSFHKNSSIKTIYIGGGTPSILTYTQLNKIISAIQNNFKFENNIEFTIEVNPENITAGIPEMYKNLGINRVTIGIQSFNDRILQYLGRTYNSNIALKAIDLIGNIFSNYSIDILFAAPEVQSIEDIKNDLTQICKILPPHISIYNLVIEDRTFFGWLKSKGKLIEIEDELFEETYLLFHKILVEKNYNHYEISTFAKKNYECRHNLTYWRNEEYIGIGAGAHSYISETRSWNIKYPEHYIKRLSAEKNPIEDSETLEISRRIGETIMLALHLEEGIDLLKLKFKDNHNLFELYAEKISRLTHDGLITATGGSIKLTLKGRLFANIAAREFL